MSNQHKSTSAPFDSDVDRLIELDELDFSNDEEGESFADLAPEDELDTQNYDANPAMPGDDPTLDDLSPEILIEENGALSPHEPGENNPADKQLSIVNEDEIGAGYGLDEAELARAEPLDGKRE